MVAEGGIETTKSFVFEEELLALRELKRASLWHLALKSDLAEVQICT